MKKKIFLIVTFSLVLIGLIFFITKGYEKEDNYEGVLVEEQQIKGWVQV